MEEGSGIGQLVLFGVLIVLTIIQQLVKGSKKRKEVPPISTDYDEDRELFEEPWIDHYAPLSDNSYGSNPDTEYEVEEHDYVATTNSIYENIRTVESCDTDISLTCEESSFSARNASELMSDFELDKAIIYSELLSPKFKDI